MGEMVTDNAKLRSLIAESKASGGAELANYQPFVAGLCRALGLPEPNFSKEQNHLNDYVFERRVDFKHADGSRSAGRIDCYRRGCFVLEAKQSGKRRAKTSVGQLDLIPEDEAQTKQGQAKRGTRGWDQVMLAARKQAEDYARALPVEHGYPPFLLVVDVGHVIEVYADFSGQERTTPTFPTGAATASSSTTSGRKQFRTGFVPSGRIRFPSTRHGSRPRSPATSPRGWRGSPGASKAGTTRKTWPSS